MLSDSLLILALIILLNMIIVLIICFLGIRFAKIRILTVIHMRQYFITMLSTGLISCYFSPLIATVLYIALFFLYRKLIFKKDALEEQHIYSLYNGDIHLSPPIQKISLIFQCQYIGSETESLSKEYLYSFSRYLDSAVYIFIFYCINGMEHPENAIIYGINFFLAITTLFIVIAKLVYHLSLWTPTSLFFLSPKLSYIPVILVALLFYGVAVMIFMATL